MNLITGVLVQRFLRNYIRNATRVISPAHLVFISRPLMTDPLISMK